MAVIVNEFEVVAELPTAKSSAASTAADQTQKLQQPCTAHDIQRMMRQHMYRQARVRAH
jgi:hypothetical protein